MHRHILKPTQNFLPNKGRRVWKEKPWQVFLICFDVSVSTKLIHKERANTGHVSNLHSKHLPQKEAPQNCFGSSSFKTLYLVVFTNGVRTRDNKQSLANTIWRYIKYKE